MNYPVIAAQMYTIREYTKTPEDILRSMKRLKDIGYSSVQVSGTGPIDHQELKDMADEAKLSICATHIGFERLANDIEDVIRQHQLWNCRYVGLGAMPVRYQGSREGFEAFARQASAFARVLYDNGLRFIYHNHSFEFQRFDGTLGMEILLERSDPEVFDFELDTYWVQHGGADPIDWIKRVKGRMKVIHFKDMVMGHDGSQLMAEVGEGNLNWSGIIDACRETGVEWALVEQDICMRNPFDSLAISLDNLKAMGLPTV